MPGQFADSPGKQVVRNMWNTPVLTYLHKSYGIRFRYMGLPGVELLDVIQWREMIQEVVAFQMRATPRSDDPDGRRDIRRLRRNLAVLGIPGRTYVGPMEEVIILRQDYDGAEYAQDRLVTLYNLDFCDEIGSKIETRDAGRKVWRYEAIRQMLIDQHECHRSHGHDSGFFVVLLTVRDQMRADVLSSLLGSNLYHDTQSYVGRCSGPGGHPLPIGGPVIGTHTWALKAFLHNTIRQYLIGPNMSALFFPFVKYWGRDVRTRQGSLPSPMLHLMILCRFNALDAASPLHLPGDYLAATATVRATPNQSLVWEPLHGEIHPGSAPPSSEQWIRRFGPDFLRDVRVSSGAGSMP